MIGPITFPFPPRELFPNVKVHWAVEAKQAKKYKVDCTKICWLHKIRPIECESLELHVKFTPPDYRNRDADNMVRAFKHGQDALCAALKIDDSKILKCTYAKGGSVKFGVVIVTVTPIYAMAVAA